MSGFFSSFWQRLLRDLGLRREQAQVYQFDDTLIQSVQELAEREQRPEEDIASDLLSYALARRGVAEASLEMWQRLTPREQQVAALTCLGCTNYQIASRLLISHETVKTHMRKILHKFNVHSKVELQQALDGWYFSDWGEG